VFLLLALRRLVLLALLHLCRRRLLQWPYLLEILF
jgi:hypothetical protein